MSLLPNVNMKREKLIEKAYSVFSKFKKPAQCSNQAGFEDAEFNAMMPSVSRRDLSMKQIGTVAWGPMPSMTPEALAYFMPRFIELAVSNAIDIAGDPFFCYFVNSFHEDTGNERFKLFESAPRKIMAETFRFLCDNCQGTLEMEGCLMRLNMALGIGVTFNL